MTLDQFAADLVGWIWASPLFFMLLGCGLIFTLGTKFVQWRIFTHGYACIRGRFDKPGDTGHINHFQALCAALSATVGLGNIAGVAVAISIGGPGAVFWMWIVGFLGMGLKFMECTLAVMFRDERNVSDSEAKTGMRSEVRGGPMWYIQKALVDPLKKKGSLFWFPFKVLAVLFAISTMLNSFGGGNMFQGWNISNTLKLYFDVPVYLSATLVSVLVAVVIIGGIKRIGTVASKLVPFMCVIYVAGALYVVLSHASEIPHYLALIVESAFTSTAGTGGFAGATIWIAFQQGLRRACFSNEAGEGSAAMAHAAARTDEPIREGVVAGIGPFIDTLVICTLSALVLLMTGAWQRPALGTIEAIKGNTVVVRCNGDVPEHFHQTYAAALSGKAGLRLAVFVKHEQGRDADTVVLAVDGVKGTLDKGWTGVSKITLSLDDQNVSEDDRGRVAVGQAVHLDLDGAKLTAVAFDTSMFGFGKYMVTLGVLLFGFSTMVSWSYYGEKGAEYLLGSGAILPFKFVFVLFVFLGMVLPKFQTVYDFSDATTGMMVLCNLPAVLILAPTVIRAAKTYFRRLDAGEFPRNDR